MSVIGIIGGSGLYNIEGVTIKGKKAINTPYGKPSDKYTIAELDGKRLIFLPRHGGKHSIPPHKINYMANIYGFKRLGVERIVSISAVGGIRKGLKPGDIVILNQIIDMTRSRKTTFYDGKEGVIHIDFTQPYCPELRRTILEAGKGMGIRIKDGGTYVAVDGPRLETAAEIRYFGAIGGDVVGMTGMPEASLARELEICYSGISVVANYAAGITDKRLTTSEVMEVMSSTSERLRGLLGEIVRLIPDERGCLCGETLKEARI
ncbi:MAG: S-methyl-5'-thioadenosine phosphorylase [Thermodesulfovibrionia bacterium]